MRLVPAQTRSHAAGQSSYFGDLVPYGDPMWYQDWASPYYKDSHRRLRAFTRKFVDDEIAPNAHEWDEAREVPMCSYALPFVSATLTPTVFNSRALDSTRIYEVVCPKGL
jgi:hypothetical protein